jgi:hypothetical protein
VLANTSLPGPWENGEELRGGVGLPWTTKKSQLEEYPWVPRATEKSAGNRGCLETVDNLAAFIVNSSPILIEDGTRHGALASFNDVTQLENSRAAAAIARRLKKSRDELHRRTSN